MSYDIYFDKVLLPVAPSKIQTSIKNKNKTIELINEGDVNMLKGAGLTELSFDILLPNQRYPFAKYPNGFKNAAYYMGILEKYKKNKIPFRVIISRTLPKGRVLFYTNMMVSLEDYAISDDVKNGFDNTVKVNLKQYKEYGTKTVKIATTSTKKTTQKATTKRAAGAGSKTSGKTYTIVRGDCMWNISKKFLGSGARWKEIYNANKSIIESTAKKYGRASSGNGHWIYPGTKITIP